MLKNVENLEIVFNDYLLIRTNSGNGTTFFFLILKKNIFVHTGCLGKDAL